MPVKKVCNMLTVIFVIVLSLVTFFNINVYAAIATPGGGESGNSTSADWSKVKYVQMKAETLAYEESTGTNVLSTKWFNKEDVINRYKIYEVIENKGNRIKLKIPVTGLFNDLEGWVNKSDVYVYQGQNVKVPVLGQNGKIVRYIEGKVTGKNSSNSWNLEANGDDSSRTTATTDEVMPSTENVEDNEDWNQFDDVSEKNDNIREEIVNFDVKSAKEEELVNEYQKIIDYQKEVGTGDTEVQKKKQEIEEELSTKYGYDSDDILGVQTELEVSSHIYKKPTVSNSGDSSDSLDDMMSDGDDFIQSAGDSPIKTDQLQSVSSNLYNIFVEVGVALAVIIGLVIGIKYMYSSVDQKAEIKKLLVPYLVGCVVIFGALGIWKFVVTLLETV